MVIIKKEYTKRDTWFQACRIWNGKLDIVCYSRTTLEKYLSGDLFVFDFKINGKDKEIIYKEYGKGKKKVNE